ncbi:MAG: TolC family protein [Cyanobacteria bacterium HKST-UBA02]|nr:TolC family protein [Cyanobacteria bacterium HKST-UBA02]
MRLVRMSKTYGRRRRRSVLAAPALSLFAMISLAAGAAIAQDSSDTVDSSLRGPIDQNRPDLNKSTEPGESLPVDVSNDTDAFDPEQLKLSRPELSGLITISDRLSPLNLDASAPSMVSLDDVLKTCLERNLDIGIASTDRSTQGWKYLASMGRFLPVAKLAYSYNYLKGTLNLPIGQSPDPLHFNNPFILSSAGFTYYGYRGGSVLFGALKERNMYRASREGEKQTIDDALRETYEKYYRLLLEESVLRIRIKAVEVSEEQVRLNRELFEAGSATQLDVMQAETQLSRDRQNLIDQQVKRRQVAIELADFLNLPQDLDLMPDSLALRKCELVDERSDIGKLIGKAMAARPILKQREQERLAARKEIVIASAPLQPSLKMDGNVYGIGETLSRQTKTVVASIPVVSPTGSVGSVPQVRRVNRQISALYQLGVSVNWNFDGLGTSDMALTQAARVNARAAQLKQTKEVNRVINQVRQSFLNILRTDRQIEEALTQLRAAREEIKLARLRYENGLGKNIDILKAQQDYTDALIRKATAIVEYNIAQAGLLRDTGIISVSSLTTRSPLKL